MPKCDDCAGRRCSCVIVDGANTTVNGTGSRDDPYSLDVSDPAGGGRFAGEIVAYGGAAAPAGWLLANGQAVSRTTYAALFAAIGTIHGVGDGSLTFNVPDLAGRFAFGADGVTAPGTVAGLTEVTLDAGQVPTHAHGMDHIHAVEHGKGAVPVGASGGVPAYLALGWDLAVLPTPPINTGDAFPTVTAPNDNGGGPDPVPTMPPYTAVTYLIKT